MLGFVKNWVAPSSWISWIKGPGCPAGDFACELTGGKVKLPSLLSSLIAKTEELTGVSKYISGPIIVAGAAVATVEILRRKYKADNAYDLIQKIIDTEFGKGSAADLLFQAFKKVIEDAIEAALNNAKATMPANTKSMSIKEQAEFRKRTKAAVLKQLAPQLAEALKAQKPALAGAAKALADKTVAKDAPKEQQAALRAPLEQQAAALVQGILNPKVDPKSALVAKK